MKLLITSLRVSLGASASLILLAIPSKAQSNLNALTYEGTQYCIGVDTGTYYFAGTNVTGFGGADGETTRAEFSETIPDPVNQSQPGNANKGLQTNQNHWTLFSDNDSPWGFEQYQRGDGTNPEGSGNTFAEFVSNQDAFEDVRVTTGIGRANRLRGYTNGNYLNHVDDTAIKAYEVTNVARGYALNNCFPVNAIPFPFDPDLIINPFPIVDPGLIAPEKENLIDREKLVYTYQDVVDGAVKPIFVGGTLSFEKGSLSAVQNFEVRDYPTNTIDNAGRNIELSGVLSGPGGMNYKGDGITTLSGVNTYLGGTTLESGVIAVANNSAIPQFSSTLVKGTGRLDLVSNLVGAFGFRIDDLSVKESGTVFIDSRQPLFANRIVLDATSGDQRNTGGFVATLRDKNNPPIRVSDNFKYQSGSLFVVASPSNQPRGVWQIIEGNVVNADGLSKNTFLTVLGPNGGNYEFSGLGKENAVDSASAIYQGYLKEGSLDLDLVIEVKSKDDLYCDLNPGVEKCGGVALDPGPLMGCDSGDSLCGIISSYFGDSGRLLGVDRDLASNAISVLVDGLENSEIDLPFGFDYGQLAKLVGSGLLPRNVDATGRSLFNYNNLLVDTVFERLPLRQFRPVEVTAVVEEEDVMVEPATEAPVEPIRGLWSQTEGMDEHRAQQYLQQRVAQGEQGLVDDVGFEFDGVGYVEDPSLTAQYSGREGVRAWYRGFGGDLGPTTTSTLYGNYNASAGGMVLGADVSLGSNVQIGVFGNYGDVTLNQFGGDTGSGSWNPTGWGGGITADWWSDNFYVQGLISASSFSGRQSRNIIRINDKLGNETASGEKSATSYAYAIRLGAPFQNGRLLLEPQFTAAWTQNQESGFSENGADQLNLRYGSRTTNFLQTELGMKFALPIKSGERGEWVPSVRVAWLGDWNQNNEDQSIGYDFTNNTVGVAPLEENQNGVLIEGGLDYTVANIKNGSWKLYARGGAEVWGGERGTDWRASGGMTWQF